MPVSANITGVIVADDDAMIRSVLRAKLEALDINVFLASDGLEAIDYASRIHAALIILDLKMPRLNGLIACERIRALPGNARTPIVILTALPGKETETAAIRAGATGYYVKPFRPASLLQALSQFLPVDDAARDQIRRNAELANDIARSPGSPACEPTPTGRGADVRLDRGKNILNILRG